MREECRLRVFENGVLRRIFGPKRDEVTGEWRKLHNEKLKGLYSSANIVRVIKSRRMRWAGHVARTILGDEYRPFSSSLCNFLHSPVTSSLLGRNILLSTPFIVIIIIIIIIIIIRYTHACPSQCVKREMSQCCGIKQYTQTEKLQQIGRI